MKDENTIPEGLRIAVREPARCYMFNTVYEVVDWSEPIAPRPGGFTSFDQQYGQSAQQIVMQQQQTGMGGLAGQQGSPLGSWAFGPWRW